MSISRVCLCVRKKISLVITSRFGQNSFSNNIIVTKRVLPKSRRTHALQLAHDVSTTGHFGRHKTYEH